MRKTVEIAFAIALIILSVIATVWQNDFIGDIIYAIVIPSFLLSIITFVKEISEMCERDSEELKQKLKSAAENESNTADEDLKLYEEGSYKVQYHEAVVPKEIYEKKKKGVDLLKGALTMMEINHLFVKCSRILQRITVVGYILLFLSLFFSPYIAKWLSVINLNCISLWSLTLLFFTLELKTIICEVIVSRMYLFHRKRLEKKHEIDS